MAFFVDPLLII